MWLGHIFYRIDTWLPASWPEIDEGNLRRALEFLAVQGHMRNDLSYISSTAVAFHREAQMDLQRAACALFWHVFYWPDEFSANQLQDLRSTWRYEIQPDCPPDWTRAYVNIHIAGALAVLLYKTDKSFSESLQDVVSDIVRLASYLKSTDALQEPGLYYSYDPEYFNSTVPLRRSLPIVCAMGWCFYFYLVRARGEAVAAFDSAFAAFECADEANRIHRFAEEAQAAIEQQNAPLGLVAMWMRINHITDVFDQIYQSIESKVDWADLAARCDEMRWYYDRLLPWAEENRFFVDRFVKSEVGKFRTESGSEWSPHYPVSEFWTYARGLCVTRLSPDTYRKLREEDERHAAQARLRHYFFGEDWEELPREAKDALITADRIYWSPDGRKGDILENLRLAVEPIIEQQLVIPFRAWCSQHNEQNPDSSQYGRQATFLRLSIHLRELWGNRRLFEEFTRKVFPDKDQSFWQALRENLYALRNQRGVTVHPEDREPVTIADISGHYRRFVGIGQRGIIIDLLGLCPLLR